ncbi:MAG: hypothetical protein IJ155_12010, partial [Prevotella sp.]|nr:hypothetical protein [Prevotella sp.]
LTVFPQVTLTRVTTKGRFRAGSACFSGESPKSVGENPCLSGFQTGRIHENVKTAEVRTARGEELSS